MQIIEAKKSELRFGAFFAPFHSLDENPTLAIERDLELVEYLDRLGFHEAWIGEHHSGGLEFISSPEVFIASAAERTKNIKLGTGVVSLPYHHPLVVADRISQLDHQLRGRAMFGVGAGSLASDVYMMGLEQNELRQRTEESLEAVQALLQGEVVTKDANWFRLRKARCQLRPYNPHMQTVVASTGSPWGPKTAGKHGVGVLSLGVSASAGYGALATTWDAWSGSAQLHDKTIRRSEWRIAGPVHIAETREQARSNVRYGVQSWVNYLNKLSPLQIPVDDSAGVDATIDGLLATGMAIIGTPDDLIQRIEELWSKSGGFGCWLDMVPNWAEFPAMKRSYELIAHYVLPHFSRINTSRSESYEWAAAQREEFLSVRSAVVANEFRKWEQDRPKN